MQVTEEMVRIKAYELWEADGKPQDKAQENWFAALALLQESTSEPPKRTKPPKKRKRPPIGLKQLKQS